MANNLGKLGYAVGANAGDTSETALAADGRGSTGTQTAMSDFKATFSSIAGNPLVPAGGSRTYTATFTGAGSLFDSRIKNRTTLFVWSLDDGSGQGYITPAGYTCTVFNTAGVGDPATLHCTFNDHYNGSTSRSVALDFDVI